MTARSRRATSRAQAAEGVVAASSRFDADRSALVTRNGVVVLGAKGATFGPTDREDYATRSTAAEYRPGHRSASWEQFLKRTLPTRRFATTCRSWRAIQSKPATLPGGWCFSSGRADRKIELIEAVAAVLGSYAGVFDLTMFRSKAARSATRRCRGPDPAIRAYLGGERRVAVARRPNQARNGRRHDEGTQPSRQRLR